MCYVIWNFVDMEPSTMHMRVLRQVHTTRTYGPYVWARRMGLMYGRYVGLYLRVVRTGP